MEGAGGGGGLQSLHLLQCKVQEVHQLPPESKSSYCKAGVLNSWPGGCLWPTMHSLNISVEERGEKKDLPL